MGGYESELPAKTAEGDLIAAAQHIVEALGTKKLLSQNERKILVDLRTQLTTMTMVDDPKTTAIEPPSKGVCETEYYLDVVADKIMNRVCDESMIWDSGPDDVSEYLKAVDEARTLTEKLENLCLSKDDEEVELLRKAHDVLQTAMARLEQEFEHIIIQHGQPFEPEQMSFRSSEGDGVVGSPYSLEDDLLEDSLRKDFIGKNLEDFLVDLVHPDVISDLKCIANLMFICNYDHECSQAFVNGRKHALSRCLFVLEVEPLSIDDVLKMEWGSLDSQIKRWVWAIKIFVRGYLASEKRLCDEIFGEFGSWSFQCFTDLSKAAVMQLLSFGNAVSVTPRQPEKLFRVLDMYEVLVELHPDINFLYVDKSFRDEFCEVLRRLGDALRATFLEFKSAIATNPSVNPFAGGGTHHLTRYVMNYLKLLTDYRGTLNQILEESHSPLAESVAFGDEINQFDSTFNSTPMALHFRSITSVLIANIDEKSKLYKDPALQHFFLMNNIHYIAQKVKNSELRDIFGDDWIKRHNGKFQQQAMNYERATWSSILSLLRDDGSQISGSNSSIKNVLKERLRSFYASFEEVYRNQTGWLIKDPQLQEDLRISTSLKVIQAYRTFVGRHCNDISDKYIKYTADDLENYILDLFSGSQRSLNNIYRK